MNEQFLYIIPLVVGFILDLIIGDPRRLPHPICFFGNVISHGENHLNNGTHKKLKGTFLTIILVFSVWLMLFVFQNTLSQYFLPYTIITSILVFYGLANRTLTTEVLNVERKLSTEGLDAGRAQLSFIVGRETKNLPENKIRIATLETLSENLSDGVIAPLFYYAIGGIPAMFAYKMINTLDSMIGYKNDRYKDFGWFAAKIDDVANYIPARLTALLMILVTFNTKGLRYIFKYGHKHASPNSGYPESALAGILDCRFGGPNVYHGQLVEKPYIGENYRVITGNDILKACAINIAVSVVFLVLLLTGYYFQNIS